MTKGLILAENSKKWKKFHKDLNAMTLDLGKDNKIAFKIDGHIFKISPNKIEKIKKEVNL